MSATTTTAQDQPTVTLHGSVQSLALAYAIRHDLNIRLPRPRP